MGIEGERPTASVLLLAAERSGGNPLLAEEVLAARRELAGVSFGSSLDELVAARLALRGPECRRVLRLLALAEEPLVRDDLQRVAAAFEVDAAGLPPRSTGRPRHGAAGLDADLRAGLEEALQWGFVVELPDGAVEIRHELVARAIAADLLPMQRRRHHVAFAGAFADRPATRARNWLAAHETDLARDALLEAAGEAAARGAAADQLTLLELAMELGAAEVGDKAMTGLLLLETADVALAAARPDRALAYLESAAARFGEREDRARLAGLHDRLGRVARILGDHERALSEHRRAASLAPREASPLRARVLGSLAQTLMLLGQFAEAETVARAAIDVARTVGPEARAAEGHATCTLGIARAWSAAPADAIALLEDARGIAAEVGDADDWFRATLNLTTALTLLHRGDEAIAVTMEAIERARLDGVEAVYGNALRGNVAEALFLTGRWAEAREAIRKALEWSPAADAFADAAVTSAMLEVESASGERAARLLGRRLLELRNAPDPQSVVPASRAAASFAMWRGDLGDAGRAAELGWSMVRDSEDWVLAARMAATYLEVQAAMVADAHDRRALPELAAASERAQRTLEEAEKILRSSGVPNDATSRGEAEAQLATARAYAARLDGRDTPVVWDAHREGLGGGWGSLPGRARPLAPGRGLPAGTRRPGGPRGSSRPAPGCGPHRPASSERRPSSASSKSWPGGLSSRCRRTRRRKRPPKRQPPARRQPPRASRPGPSRSSPTASWSQQAPALAAPGRPRSGQWTYAGPCRAVGQPAAGGRRPGDACGSCRPDRGGVRGAAPGPPRCRLRPLEPRARGPRPDRPGANQPRDRGAPLHQPEDRRRPRREHPVEARRVGSRGGGHGRRPPGARPRLQRLIARGGGAAHLPDMKRDPEEGPGLVSTWLVRQEDAGPGELCGAGPTSASSPLRPERSQRAGKRPRRAARPA